MQRILHYGVGQNPGGIESYLLKLYRNIDRNNYKFFFINDTGGKLAFEDELRTMGAEICRITHRRHSLLQNRKDIEQLFSNNKFDIFHCHVNTLSYITPISVAQKYKCPVLLHSRSAGCKRIHTRLLHQLHKYAINWNNLQCVAVSDKAGRWLFGKHSYTVLNNGVETRKFAFSQESRDRLRRLLAPNDETILIHIGAFTPAKNHLFLIDIYEAYLKINPGSFLLLVGGNGSIQQTEKYVQQKGLSERVRFLGIRHDIPDLLCAADIFVFPSLFEGFPNAVLEAETTGLICVISDLISREVFIDGQAVALSLKMSPETWAQTVTQSLAVDIDRRNAAQIIRKKGFSVEEEIQRLCGIYTKLLQENKIY